MNGIAFKTYVCSSGLTREKSLSVSLFLSLSLSVCLSLDPSIDTNYSWK
jgi:hypothetical protein